MQLVSYPFLFMYFLVLPSLFASSIYLVVFILVKVTYENALLVEPQIFFCPTYYPWTYHKVSVQVYGMWLGYPLTIVVHDLAQICLFYSYLDEWPMGCRRECKEVGTSKKANWWEWSAGNGMWTLSEEVWQSAGHDLFSKLVVWMSCMVNWIKYLHQECWASLKTRFSEWLLWCMCCFIWIQGRYLRKLWELLFCGPLSSTCCIPRGGGVTFKKLLMTYKVCTFIA